MSILAPAAAFCLASPQFKCQYMDKLCENGKKWVRRLVTYDREQRILYYYKNDKEKLPRQIINLQLYQVMPVYGADINFDHDPSHGFKLQNNGYRTWIFMTPSAAEARDWIDTLANQMLPMSVMNPGQNNMMSVTMMPPPGMMNPGMMPYPPQPGMPNMAPPYFGNDGGMYRPNPSFIPYIILTPESPENPKVEREVTTIIRVGRASENSSRQNDVMITYRSRVISRHHAEIWADEKGEIFVRDTGSQCGTFLNGVRLSETGKESKPYRIKTGDMVQFGVDFKKDESGMAKAIVVKVEIEKKLFNPATMNFPPPGMDPMMQQQQMIPNQGMPPRPQY